MNHPLDIDIVEYAEGHCRGWDLALMLEHLKICSLCRMKLHRVQPKSEEE